MNAESIERYYRFCGVEHRCAYCGDVADTTDHTVPRSHVIEHRRAYRGHWFPKVAACHECNVLLHDRLFLRFSERKAFIAKRLFRRNRKVLSALAWDAAEIRAMGRTLQTKIASSQRKGAAAAKRIRFAEFPVTHGVPDWLFEQRKSVHADVLAVA